MAFEKFSKDAATKTHGAVEASVIDLVMPTTELVGTTANVIRSAAHVAGGYMWAKKKITGNFF